MIFEKYAAEYPELAREYKEYFENREIKPSVTASADMPEATRISGGKALNEIAKSVAS